MAYLTDADIGSGRFTFPTVRTSNTRSASRPTRQIPGEDDTRGRQVYVDHVYGGPVSDKPEVQQAIAKQYDYNKLRVQAGKAPLKIADVRWDPTSYDDLMNEWMAQRYQETGKLPSGEERLNHYQEDAAKKWRETFEVAAKPAEYQPIAGGLSALKESVEPPTHQAAQVNQYQQEQPLRNSTMDPLSLAGGMSQLAGNETSGQPTAYEQAKALGMQTAPTKTRDMVAAKGQGGGSGRSAWVNALDQFLPKSILPEAPLPAQADMPTWIPKWILQAQDAAQVLNRALPSNLATNYLLGTVPTAIKSLYLNGVSAGVNALADKPMEYTPDMTMADYTAQEARKLNVVDPLAEANKISPWLGIPAGILAEGLSDPMTFAGLGEVQAIARGRQLGSLGRFRADARAAALEKAKAELAPPADVVAQTLTEGYTSGGEAGLQGAQENISSQLTRAQRRNTNALKNIVENNLKDSDFSGTLADLQGKPIPNGSGGFFDHMTEMKQSYAGLKGIKRGIEGSLQNPNLSPEVRAHLQENLDATNYYLGKIEDLFKPYGGIQ